MLKNLLLPLLFLLPFCACAQSDAKEREAVITVVQRMFEAMRTGDSTLLRSTFDPNARLQTAVTNKAGKPMLLEETVDEFAKAVGAPHDEVWDERPWGFDVRVDGRLASVWVEYSFFAGEKMSHCGVDAFQLFNGADGWKITQITDTRRKDGCQTDPNADLTAINQLMDNWHHAAAVADEDVFFGSMTADGIYLGTDASERWLRDEMKEWSKKYFDRDTAWAFTPHDRHVYFSENGQMAWFEELLDTWMGPCRGSGVLMKTPDGWKIKHYDLAVAVANDIVNDYIKLLPKK
jgi:hypothetical protein